MTVIIQLFTSEPRREDNDEFPFTGDKVFYERVGIICPRKVLSKIYDGRSCQTKSIETNRHQERKHKFKYYEVYWVAVIDWKKTNMHLESLQCSNVGI